MAEQRKGWWNGKKTVVGALGLIVLFGPQIVGEIAKIITEGGGDPATFLKIGSYVLTAAGLIHKFVKTASE